MKKILENKVALVTGICSVIDFVVWLIFRSSVKQFAEENICSFKTTAFFVFNIIVLISIALLSAAVFIKKMQLNTDLLQVVSGNGTQNALSQMSSAVTQMSSAVSQMVSNAATNTKTSKEPIIGYCQKCGTGIPYDSKFCTSCGTAVPESLIKEAEERRKTAEEAETARNEEAETVEKATEVVGTAADVPTRKEAEKNAKVLPKKIIAISCAAVVLLIAIIAYSSNAAKTIDLNKYMKIESEGYDGYGKARATIDWDAIEEKYGSKVSFTSEAKREYGGLLGLTSPMEGLRTCVSVKIKENDNLSNGEVVEYVWEIDEDLIKVIKCKIKYKDGSYKVSGLSEVGTFDAFADMTVEFNGVAPKGKANINYLGSELGYHDFSCDKTNGLSNGDIVKITIDESKIEYYAKNLGKVPAEFEKEFKVEGLESYVTKLAEIDQEAMQAMQQQATDLYNAKVAKDWGDGEDLVSFTYIGDYLLSAKNPDSSGPSNYLLLVYKAQVKNYYSNNENSYDKVNDIYWFVRFDNLMVGADGKTSVNVTSYHTPNNSFTIDSGVNSGWWSTKSWYYYGYENLDDLYRKAVTSNIDSYYHEDNIDESVAPETVVEEKPETLVLTNEDYILPNSDKELIEKKDLEGFSDEQCKRARNEIYARHGRKFKDDSLQEYFNSKDWYKGTISPNNFQESTLSEIEIKNRDIIIEFEKEKGFGLN